MARGRGGRSSPGAGPVAAGNRMRAVEGPMIALRPRWVAGGLAAAVLAGLVLVATVSSAREKAKDRLDLSKIPNVLMDALKVKFPKPEVTKWTKEIEGGNVIYDIELKQEGRKCEAGTKEDGTILNFEKEIATRDLPAAVTKAVEKKYSKATLKEIMEITEVKGKVEKLEGYEVVLETASKKEVEVTRGRDGKILEGSGGKMEETKE